MSNNNPIRCELLGGFSLKDGNGEEIQLPVTKGKALIAYLLLSPQNSLSRSALVGLLWSEKAEANARTALRQCLHQLKAHLAKTQHSFLTITSTAVSVDPAQITTDINEICDGPVGLISGMGVIDSDRLLYGFEDLDPAYTEWLYEQRRLVRATIRAALTERLMNAPMGKDRLHIAQALHQIDPSIELAARPLIDAHIKSGNVVELLRVYGALWDALSQDWNEEPSQELQDLVGRARVDLANRLPARPRQQEADYVRRYVGILAVQVHPLEQGNDYSAQSECGDALASLIALTKTHGGQLVSQESSGFCVVFGLPRSNETIAINAISAALDLRAAAACKGLGVALAGGIDCGLAEVSASNLVQATFDVRGKTVQNAQRIANLASPGEILTTPHTVQRLQGSFVLEEPEGEAGLVSVVDPVTDDPMPETAMPENFIGRDLFLAALRHSWTETESSGFQLVSIHAPPGMGKTCLAGEFIRELIRQGHKHFAANCSRAERSAPLEPVRQLLSQLHSDHTIDSHTPATLVDQLAKGLGPHRQLIFIDDWHWVDQASRLVIQDLARAIRNRPVLLILASRVIAPDDGLIQASQQISLSPLTAREVQRYAEMVLGRPVNQSLRRRILALTGGNPLYLDEVCRVLASSTGGVDSATLPVSASLSGLIANRLDQLDAQERALVFAAAAHRDRLDPSLLADVLGQPLPEEALDRLLAKDVFSTSLFESGLQFRHGMVREVAYSMIPPEEKRTLHKRYVQSLRARVDADGLDTVVEQLALHADLAGDRSAACDYAERAGHKALAASALDQALHQLSAAMTHLEEMEPGTARDLRWLKNAILWARPSVYSASPEHIAVFAKARHLAGTLRDTAHQAEILYWMGYNLLVQGLYEDANSCLSDAHEIAQATGLERLAWETAAIKGCSLAATSNYEAASSLIEEAIAAKDRNPVKKGRAPVTSVYARAILALIRADQGAFAEGEALLGEALTRVADFSHEIESSICNLAAVVYLWNGNWDKAREFARRSLERSERVSAPYLTGMARCLQCFADWRVAGRSGNLEELKMFAHWMDAQGMRLYLSFPYGWIAEMACEMGRWENVLLAARRAIALSETGERAGLPMAYRALAQVPKDIRPDWLGSPSANLAQARTWAAARNSPHESALCDLAEAQMIRADANQRERTLALARQARSVFVDLGMLWHVERSEVLIARTAATSKVSATGSAG